MNELIADELTKLAQLRDQNVLTRAEFDERKALLLARRPASSLPTGLRAWFGCLGLILAIVLLNRISWLFDDKCMPEPSVAASGAAMDAADIANDAAAAAGAGSNR